MSADAGPRCPECRMGLGSHDYRDPQCDHHTANELFWKGFDK